MRYVGFALGLCVHILCAQEVKQDLAKINSPIAQNAPLDAQSPALDSINTESTNTETTDLPNVSPAQADSINPRQIQNLDSINAPKEPPKAITEPAIAESYMALYPHKSVYFLPLYHSFTKPALGDKDTESKFQFSFRMRLIKELFSPYGALYFAYTQTAWFQNYNKMDSRPFRDFDYQPEFFYSYKYPLSFLGGAFKEITLGYNHISNGERELRSRTQNRILLNMRWEYETQHIGTFGIKLGVWTYIGEHVPGFIHDNGDLPLYRGYNDIGLYYKSNRHLLEFYARPPIAARYYPFFELGYTLRVSENLGLYCQYINGYGDNMFEYQQYARRIGVGFRLWNK
ncbi:phospholipase [Helicobacter jaachi]|uniref:Phosphatidylcholine 1-acylhydrolase n=1 Tax=Helicobacter jaachi TaxID=1677920 RepID=A0A4U8TBY8_9HELI|nr:phospholipase A [Helicobacter jaachi]TLD97439.1 phospholipase [Helicobacter jaachi]